jgi:hypothetical protein
MLILLSAVAVAAALFVVLPLPVSGAGRVGAVVAIGALDAFAFGALWRARLLAHRAELTERLAQMGREVIEAERLASVGRIAAGIAHEVGNPLTGIANYAHVLRARAGASPEALAALSGIEREIERIDRIVGGLLDYARPQKGPPSAFDAAGTLRQAVQLLAGQGVFRSVQVQSTIDETPLSLVGNAHEIEQVFVNLLLNAIDAMEAKGTLSLYAGRLTADTIVRPAPRRSGDAANASTERSENPRLAEWRAQHTVDEPVAKFVIADSGPGIDVNDSQRVFDPFFTTKGAGEGSGLGLAIVQRVVDSHDGVVWVQRAREGGAAFHMVLPLSALNTSPNQVS